MVPHHRMYGRCSPCRCRNWVTSASETTGTLAPCGMTRIRSVEKPCPMQSSAVAWDGTMMASASARAMTRALRKNELPRAVKCSGERRKAKSCTVTTRGAERGGIAQVVAWITSSNPRPAEALPRLVERAPRKEGFRNNDAKRMIEPAAAAVVGRETNEVHLVRRHQFVRELADVRGRSTRNLLPQLLDRDRDAQALHGVHCASLVRSCRDPFGTRQVGRSPSAPQLRGPPPDRWSPWGVAPRARPGLRWVPFDPWDPVKLRGVAAATGLGCRPVSARGGASSRGCRSGVWWLERRRTGRT